MTQIVEQQDEAMRRGVAAKLRAFHDSLTEEEGQAVDHAIRAFMAGTEAGVQGYMIAEYEDAYGWKGKIGTGGESLPPLGSGPGGAAVPAILLQVAFLIGGATLNGNVGGEYP